MREIVLDTETTGLRADEGHRIVEIGCLELINHVPTGREFQCYLNPGRPMDEGASKVSGITDAMLKDKPRFAEISPQLLAFLEEAPLVIHNAAFDIGFLNAEFKLAGQPEMPLERAIDTVRLARRKFPGAPASLDALCKRFNIDLSVRVTHGALVDARLLAEVYLELIGGRQTHLNLLGEGAGADAASSQGRQRGRDKPLPPLLTEEEAAAHAEFLKTLKGEVLWRL